MQLSTGTPLIRVMVSSPKLKEPEGYVRCKSCSRKAKDSCDHQRCLNCCEKLGEFCKGHDKLIQLRKGKMNIW